MYTFPKIDRQRLANGLRVLWVPDHEQRAMTVALQIPVGGFSDPLSYEDTAELTVVLMQKGTESLSPERFADRLEQTGASLFAETGDEHIVLGCKMLSRHANEVIPLFWEMVCSPRFDGNELERLKREMITALQAETSDPNALANKHFFSLLCGKNHPAGRVHSIQSVKRTGMTQVRAFFTAYFSPENSVLVIAGDFNGEDAARWTSLFSSWNNKQTAVQCIAEPLPALAATSIRLIDKQDITQTYFMLGHPAPGELVSDRNALALANYILGGGNFSSRLMEHVRSAKGKTYGISSQVLCNRKCGIFLIATTTLSVQTAEVLSEILAVYREFSANGVTEEELQKAKEFAIGNMAFQLEGIGNITEKLLWLSLYGREQSFIEHFDALIAAIGKDEVDGAIRSYLSSKHFSIVAVGRKEDIRQQLERFGEVKTLHFREAP
jgi:zinc protease